MRAHLSVLNHDQRIKGVTPNLTRNLYEPKKKKNTTTVYKTWLRVVREMKRNDDITKYQQQNI